VLWTETDIVGFEFHFEEKKKRAGYFKRRDRPRLCGWEWKFERYKRPEHRSRSCIFEQAETTDIRLFTQVLNSRKVAIYFERRERPRSWAWEYTFWEKKRPRACCKIILFWADRESRHRESWLHFEQKKKARKSSWTWLRLLDFWDRHRGHRTCFFLLWILRRQRDGKDIAASLGILERRNRKPSIWREESAQPPQPYKDFNQQNAIPRQSCRVWGTEAVYRYGWVLSRRGRKQTSSSKSYVLERRERARYFEQRKDSSTCSWAITF